MNDEDLFRVKVDGREVLKIIDILRTCEWVRWSAHLCGDSGHLMVVTTISI